MTQPLVSVVIVSRDRPDALTRCLTGVSQLNYPAFEVVVVADDAGIAAARSMPCADDLKLVSFQEANISAARNAGIARAAGEIVAFIDDDAVPEPSWLWYLAEPFAQQRVAAAGGFVRGRNGISFQWKARSVDLTGDAHPLKVDETRTTILTPAHGRAIKTEGTNMAVRRDVLAKLGGFDPAYRFFLDETDLNMRLAYAGYATAIVPMAQVHHGYAASPRRSAKRVPRDLSELGASLAVWLRKHCPKSEHDQVWRRFRRQQRHRLMRHLQGARLHPFALRKLMAGLCEGYASGAWRDIQTLKPLPMAGDDFSPMSGLSEATQVISGRSWNGKALRQNAQKDVQAGHRVSLFLFSPTTLFHHVAFHPDGYWVQTGGIFGKSERDQKLVKTTTFKKRLAQEVQRVAVLRLIK